ncbi:hypothetical protein [Pseudomonas mandelii]|uniref:hypothetical protein n=1 Tax=Pseudomonas mandelii TaxID=75612 RepID=UPI00209FFF09|nr:hypothetical protein [Pseudomonas mandelii]MCO8312361.1 hypothetical protein [Pseudomonas mandelii]
MPEDKHTTISLSQGTSIPEEPEPPLESADANSEIRGWKPIEFPQRNRTLLVWSMMPLTFNVPAYSGESHQVWLDFHSVNNPSAYRRILHGAWFEAVKWNTIQINAGIVEGRARLDAKWHKGDEEAPWTAQHIWVRKPAYFDNPAVVTTQIKVWARAGSTITLVRYGTTVPQSVPIMSPNADMWMDCRLLPSVRQGVHDLQIREDVAGTHGRYTERKTYTVLAPPSITLPISNPPTAAQRPVISGSGAHPGAQITVYVSNSGTPVVVDETVKGDGTWSATSLHTFAPGPHSIVARQTYQGVTTAWGADREFYLVGPPRITTPGSLHTVEGTSTFEGAAPAHRWGNSVRLRSETTNADLGSTSVIYETGRWSTSVTLTPGPHSIVGTHTYLDVTSVGSSPFTLLVRPAKPTLLSRPKGDGVELHGTGDNGARMDIHFSNNETPYLDTSVSSMGIWTKDLPTDLVPATHRLTGRQSVSDGGSGRIYNSGWANEVSVSIPTPPPTNVIATVYGQRATFSGRGRQWGTYEVKIGIYNNGSALAGVPQTTVQTNLGWSISATADLAPGVYSDLTARQWVNHRWSGDSAKIATMTIPSPPPEFINPPSNVPSGQRPQISGSAWPESAIVLKIPEKPDVPLTATLGTFTLNADEDWAPGTYTLTATAAFGGGLPSAPGSRSFTVKSPVPIITTAGNAEVDLVPVIEGTGFPGCWVVIYSQATHLALGSNQVLADRRWTMTLAEQAPAHLTIYAIQQDAQFSDNKSDPTAAQTVKVRVPKPGITLPEPNGRPARTSMFCGTANYPGFVALSIKGQPQPFLKDIAVNENGTWEARVTLDAGGPVTIEARLQQKTFTSEPAERVITVVPAVPVIDTPRDGEALGRYLRISGHGHVGDEVILQRTGNPYNFASLLVTEDGTWSGRFGHNMLAGDGMRAFARAGAGLDSSASDIRIFSLLGAAPQITEPLPGDWVGVRPLFSGIATPGATVAVATWFNTDEVLAPPVEADANGRWAVTGNKDLPVGAARVVVRQTVEGVRSEWAKSGRFMVERKASDFDAPTVDYPLMGQEVGRWPMFSGTGEPGAEVLIVKTNDMSTVLGRVLVYRDGRWALRSQIELPVAANAYAYSVRQSRDGATSQWLLPNRSVVVAQVAANFEKPVIGKPLNDATQVLERLPLFSGTGVPGAELKVYRHSSDEVYATTRVNAQGRWSVRSQVELPVQEAAHQIAAQQNMDGQLSAWSGAEITFKVADRIDNPVFTHPAQNAFVSPHTVIRGAALPGAEVQLVTSGNAGKLWGKGITDEQGQWVIVVNDLPLPEISLSGKAYKNGNASGWMAGLVLNVIDVG